jgi:hypothetical protein
MLQPQALRLLDVLAMQLPDQIGQLVEAGGLTAQEAEVIDRAVDEAVADLRGGRAVDTTAMPPPLAALFGLPRTPVLLTCGELDPQVPCHTIDQLASVVGHRVVLPGAGHAMTSADGRSRPS